jgi:cell division septation protein DedD
MLKDGTKRTTTTKGGRGGGMPRIMWLAIIVCVAGAVFLFRSQSSEIPTGIGENQTVVTAPELDRSVDDAANIVPDESPRSGDVDITAQTQPLTPETDKTVPARQQTPPPVAKSTVAQVPETKPQSAPKKPAAAQVKPIEAGPYVVQIGSFGKADNADREASRMQQLGWNALVKVGNTSDGKIIYRVRIGYFKARSDAETFIQQHRKQMSGAIAVHR